MVKLIFKHDTLNRERLEELLNARQGTTLGPTIQVQSVKFVEQVMLIARESLDKKTYSSLFNDGIHGNMNYFHFAAKNENYPEIFEFIGNTPLNPFAEAEKVKQLTSSDSAGGNVLMISIRYENVFKIVLETVKRKLNKQELQAMLEAFDNHQWSIFDHALSTVYIQDNLILFINCLKENVGSAVISRMLHTINSTGQTQLMVALMRFGDQTLNILFEMFEEFSTDKEQRRNYLMQRDGTNRTAFHFAMSSRNLSTILEVYEKVFSSDEMKALILSKTSGGENILFHVVHNTLTDCIEFFWKYAQDLLEDKTVLKLLLLEKNENGESFAGKIFKTDNFNEKLQVFDSFVKENFSFEEMQNYNRTILNHNENI